MGRCPWSVLGGNEMSYAAGPEPMITLDLSLFEANNLSVFLAAYIPATPSHLRGALPEIKERLDQALVESAS